jgi:hypothetical protein
MAFVIFYLEIFPEKPYRLTNFFLAALLMTDLLGECMVICLQCKPFRKAWTAGLPGNCLPLLTYFYVSFGVRLATDLVLFCLPIPVLQTLTLNRRKKLGVMLMFSMGLL